MAETDLHRDDMVYLIEALKAYFRADRQVYVAGNLFIYYEQGYPHRRVAPDVFVVFGVPRHRRRIYQLWAEGKGPDVVFEISSRRTRRDDLQEKRLLYQALGVEEYFLFDPMREYLQPPLQGYRLQNGLYQPLTPEQRANGEWSLASRRLGLTLQTERDLLRLYDPARSRKLRTPLEAAERADQEIERRRQAEARIAALEAELARLRGEE
jgi:Uma2 family endonuclease